jgi:prepilin signal peptidase PulO-like enzyme (type II secretory pathway)
LVALALVAAGRAGRRATMPYGPGLVIGALIALLL